MRKLVLSIAIVIICVSSFVYAQPPRAVKAKHADKNKDSVVNKKEREKIFFQESVKKLNELCEFRRLRLLEAGEGIDPILWFVLIFCGVITVVFTFFFGMENLRNHIIMTCLLTSIISLILFTILEFDYPFTGELSVSPKAFTSLRMFENIK